ncbi:serine/threonine kinase [Aureococcus anophagefferens]|nr:serine/threonine kinase [Aureococcus anophagefferens]
MEKYDCKKVVGKGSYGSAIVAKRKKDGLVCVVKTIALARLSRGEAKLVRQEAKLLAAAAPAHPVHGAERVQRCVVHRDVKTSNAFVTRDGGGRDVVKLGDFGISRLLDEKPYDYKADVWSVGCVLFELVALKRAFEARSMPAPGGGGDDSSSDDDDDSSDDGAAGDGDERAEYRALGGGWWLKRDPASDKWFSTRSRATATALSALAALSGATPADGRGSGRGAASAAAPVAAENGRRGSDPKAGPRRPPAAQLR